MLRVRRDNGLPEGPASEPCRIRPSGFGGAALHGSVRRPRGSLPDAHISCRLVCGAPGGPVRKGSAAVYAAIASTGSRYG